MRLDIFQMKLKASLGAKLENATPQNVREFVDQIQQEIWREEHPNLAGAPASRIEIRATKPISYEATIQSYFAQAFAADRDQSLIQLWLLSLDLAYSGIEDMQAEKMDKLFMIDESYNG
jgi:hypothetical protein